MNAPRETRPAGTTAGTTTGTTVARRTGAAGGPGVPVGPPAWTAALLVGVGVVGRELARALASLGIHRFVLVDPKRYRGSNVGTQCAEPDVGRPKVQVVARDLGARGAHAIPFHGYVEDLPPGLVPADTLVAVSADRLAAVRSASRLAVWLGLPLLRVQVEPTYDLASLEFYDYAPSPVTCCLECSWDAASYQGQLNVHSCDDRAGRPTRSSPALAAMAAHWAAVTLRARTPDRGPHELHARQLQLSGRAPGFVESVIEPNPGCRGPHRRPELVRLVQGPAAVSLADLHRRARLHPAPRIRVSGSGRFSPVNRCPRCGRVHNVLRWVATPSRATGRCDCGSDLHPVPFYLAARLDRAAFGRHWNEPLINLGVEPGAGLTLSGAGREVTFVLAPAGTRAARSAPGAAAASKGGNRDS